MFIHFSASFPKWNSIKIKKNKKKQQKNKPRSISYLLKITTIYFYLHLFNHCWNIFFPYVYWVPTSFSPFLVYLWILSIFFNPLVFLSFFSLIRKILYIKFIEPWTMSMNMGMEGTQDCAQTAWPDKSVVQWVMGWKGGFLWTPTRGSPTEPGKNICKCGASGQLSKEAEVWGNVLL